MSDKLSLNRRAFLRSSLMGASTLGFAPGLRQALSAEGPVEGKAEACILIFLEGGPSHIDTFDPKPGAPTNGPFEAIETRISGVKFSQHLPRLAGMADQLAVIRTLTSKEGDHDRAFNYLHTGYLPNPAFTYPGMGSTVAKERPPQDETAPAFITHGNTVGPAFLGPEMGAFKVDNLDQPAAFLDLPEEVTEQRLGRRLEVLERFNKQFGVRLGTAEVTQFTRLTSKANQLRKSQALRPFDVEQEPEMLRQQYGFQIGDGSWAKAALMARRFVEHGVRFVELSFSGWDTHNDNFNQVQEMSTRLDAALAGLIQDLFQRGLLEKTLVACFGEFGRTPKINGDTGRDHHSEAFSAVLAGGGLKHGLVVGESDAEGEKVKSRPVTIPEFHATFFSALGLDPLKAHNTPDGRLVRLTDNGKPVMELLG